MYETSDSHFLKDTTSIKSGTHAFDESRLVKTFLTNLGVRGILRFLRLVVEGKAAKEIRLSRQD